MKILTLTAAFVVSAGQLFAQGSADKLHDIEHFFEGAQVLSGPEIVSCTLSEGTQTKCFSITVKPEPIR